MISNPRMFDYASVINVADTSQPVINYGTTPLDGIYSNENEYTCIDLFAGCGGLSLGFEAAGIKTIGYEKVSDCCETYKQNLHSECNQINIMPIHQCKLLNYFLIFLNSIHNIPI